MSYNIGQISKMFNLPVSTLRYYDKEGLFQEISRSSGIRKFSDKEIETLHVIECLKLSGLEISEIKQFMDWCSLGKSTYQLRKKLFLKQEQAVQSEIDRLERVQAMIKFKCWYYDKAIEDGSESKLHEMIPDSLPSDIQILYNKAHGI